MRAGPPVRRTKRQKSQKMNFQKLWDSFAQNKTSEFSKNARSGTMGLLCAEQNVGSVNNALSENLGLLCAEQHVRNLTKYTFRNSGTPVRSTKLRKSQNIHLQTFWGSCAQNETSEISKNELLGIVRLLRAEQHVGNLNKCTFKNSGTPVCRPKRRKSKNTYPQ